MQSHNSVTRIKDQEDPLPNIIEFVSNRDLFSIAFKNIGSSHKMFDVIAIDLTIDVNEFSFVTSIGLLL